jgi:hypothetical protein
MVEHLVIFLESLHAFSTTEIALLIIVWFPIHLPVMYYNYFYVHDHIPVLSDHAKITININCSFEETVTPNFDCGTTVPLAYVWNKTSDIPF